MTIRSDATRLRIPQRDARQLRAVVARQGQVLLDADINGQAETLLARVEEEARDTMGSPGRLVVPAGTGAFAATIAGSPAVVSIGVGDAYLDGWRVENIAACTLAGQPHPYTGNVGATAALVLKALVRHVDPVEDGNLADSALGDAQASGRSINDWRVFPLTPANSAATCDTILSDDNWRAMALPSSGKLAFIKKTGGSSTDPCSLTPGGGYTRLENLLYRVEVHGGNALEQTADGPRFGLDGLKLKLSRRNASLMVKVSEVNGRRLTVTPPSLDARNWFAPGTYAEILSIHDDLDAAPAVTPERLFQVALASDDSVTLVEPASGAIASTGVSDDGTWFLRLWDAIPAGTNGAPVGMAAAALASNGSDSAVIDLGDGLTIQLTGGAAARFRRGDYWTCAVRADGSIAWDSGNLADIAETPHGPVVRYAPLAMIKAAAIEDCRIPLATLTDRALLYRGGDGQSVSPENAAGLVPLPAKLRVAVMRGQTPVNGARVKWEFLGPAGRTGKLEAGSNGHVAAFEQVTGPDGLAEVKWSLDPAAADEIHQVQASLVGGLAPGTPPIIFSARFHTDGDHGGCSTYVIEEGSNWVETLRFIDYDEDIAICFQRGTFSTSLFVELNGKGNVRMSGAGDGTRIVAKRGECAILFDGFASVTLRDLRVETLDTPHAPTPPKSDIEAYEKIDAIRRDRKGSITIRNTAIVDVSDMTLRCGGDIETGRTCLTVAGDKEKPSPLVRIMRNRLITGYLQDGILVTDAINTIVAQNELVVGGRGSKLNDNRLIHSKAWAKAVAKALVRRVRAVDADTRRDPDDRRILSFGDLQAVFPSSVPQAEWDVMLRANPLVGDTTPAAITAHVESLARRAAEFETGTPTVRRFVAQGRRRTATLADGAREEALLSALLPGGVEVATGRAARPTRRPPRRARNGPLAVEGDYLIYGSVTALLDTPIALADWQALFADDAVYTLNEPRDIDGFAERLMAVAYVMATDNRLRARHRNVDQWFRTHAMPATAAARQGITCGGGHLDEVTIEGNRIWGFLQGVHVGVSANDDKKQIAQNVRVSDNALYLRAPSRAHERSSGLFVGNVATLRIERNLLDWADDQPDADTRFRFGIRVHGHLGHFIIIAQNRIGITDMEKQEGGFAFVGIRVHSVDRIDKAGGYLWLAAENLVAGVPPHNVVHGDPPMRKRDNVPA
jgi:hypothetical protein